MMRHLYLRAPAAAFIALLALNSPASAGDQAKSIINSLDPKSMTELFEVSRRQPDAALTNITPVSANTFRFLFIWPGSNPVMTYDRVGRSFAERFVGFADQLKLLVRGFCLPTSHMFFGTASYGGEEVNVAYRDIQVRFRAGWQPDCAGRYLSVADVDRLFAPLPVTGYGAALPYRPRPDKPTPPPQNDLKPFLNPAQPAPIQ
ncbi:hypothetical protein [Rhodomicrobium vannielii]|nr:hypothetical protein [Rhodomicrobium vannielii]